MAETEGASDLLMTAGKPPQLSIYNQIETLDYPVLTPEMTERYCLSLLNEDQQKQFMAEKELDISFGVSGCGRFRVNCYRQRDSVAMVARIITSQIPDFNVLGLPETVRQLANLASGLVLFTGVSGSGKTSTVSSIIDYINRLRSCHIICIEDPIEFVHSHAQSLIAQREVGADTPSFHEALRRVLRQSPDVIVIGEIRDLVSAQAAITLAETGHLTLATLHTRGAVASVNRLVDIFPSDQSFQVRSQLSGSLAAVVWQKLLPQKDRKGLVLACEVMKSTPAIRALIREGKIHEIQNIIQAGRKHGMCTMDQSIRELIEKGLIEEKWLEDSPLEFSPVAI